MNNKTLDLRIDNAETSASTGSQNKENMSKETFTLPTFQTTLQLTTNCKQ